jgi:uncharacterized protein
MDPIAEQPFTPQTIEIPQPQPSTARRIFFGPFGLRAGWSLLIYLALAFSIIFSIHAVSVHLKARHEQAAVAAAAKTAGTTKASPPATAKPATPKPDDSAPQPMRSMLIGETLLFAAFFLLSWLMAVIERRRVAVFGLGGIHSLNRFLVGAFWGLASMSLLISTLRIFHLLSFDARLLHGLPIFGWGATQLLAFLLVGLAEEYIFRGYIQFTLTRGLLCIGNLIDRSHARSIAFWMAAVVTSALFFLAHTGNGGEDKIGLLLVFLAGLLFVVALWRTGSLWFGIGLHTTWDWAQSFLYGVPDSGGLMQGRLFSTHPLGNPMYSGGTVGPEGSVLCVPILILLILVLFFTHPSPQPPLETRLQPTREEPTTGPVLSVAT